MKDGRVVLMEVGNMPTGTRFMADGHSSLMIASNAFQTVDNQKYRMCVSENGSARWILVQNKFKKFDTSATRRVVAASNEIINEYLNNIHIRKVVNLQINLDTRLTSDNMKEAIGAKSVNVLLKYAINELFGGNEDIDALEKLTVGDMDGKLNFNKLRIYRGCGEGTIRLIKQTFTKAGIKLDSANTNPVSDMT